MPRSPFTFGKAISTPTVSAWSTVYSAGNIAAVISLIAEVSQKDVPPLATIGKELLQTLEAEYFTLETKNLASIKQAIEATCEKKPEGIILSLVVSVLIENVLYVFMYGKGMAFMKRGEKIGDLLSQKETGKLTAASGFLQHDDYIVLEGGSFSDVVKKEDIIPFLKKEKLPDLTDGLLSLLTDAQKGDAAAIAFSYHEETAPSPKNQESQRELSISDRTQHMRVLENQKIRNSENQKSEIADTLKKSDSSDKLTHQLLSDSHLDLSDNLKSSEPFLPESKPFPHIRKIFLTIAVVVGVILIASVFFFIKKQQDAAIAKTYQSFVIPAKQKYDEGQNLLQLNKIAAQEDFSSAKQMLSDALMRLPTNSKEAQQTRELLAKVNEAINATSQVASISAKQVDSSVSAFLTAVAKHNDTQGATQDDRSTYILTNSGVIAAAKSDGNETTLIKNNNDWKNGAALGTYLGNFYILDSSDGILKYVSTGAGYGKSNYFNNSQKPDLSNTVGMAIDQSIWVLFSDGSIKKFTRGVQDNLNISGLDKPLKSPTDIVTTVDMNNVYILDGGNNRIVVLGKKGDYVAQYQYSGLQNLKYMDVLEKDKKIYLLSGNNVYQIDMK